MEPYLKATPSGSQSPLLTSTSKDDDSNRDLRCSIPKEQDHSGLTTPAHVSLHDRELKASPLNPAAALSPVRQNIPNPSTYNGHWRSYIESDQSFWPFYKNLDEGLIKYAVQVGNHKLISLRNNEKPYTSNLAKEIQQEFIHQSKFNYIAEFLTNHKEIRYIVDIGCGDVEKSLLLQQYLNQHELDVTVCPVDIFLEDNCHLPINLIPAERIKGAGQNVAFTVIHAFTEPDCMEPDDKYYIKILIQNNPDSFVLVSEDSHLSNPNHFIPPELIYTKRFDTNKSPEESYELKKKLDVINQIMDKFPASRNMSTKVLKEITKTCHDSLKPPEYYEAIFSSYLDSMLERRGLKDFKSRQWTHQWAGSLRLATLGRVEGYFNWHVYRQNPE